MRSITLAQGQVQPPSGGAYGYGYGPPGGTGGIVKPQSGHELLLVVLQAGLLLFVVRALGEGAAALKLPSVMGELTAGLVLGPTLLGSVAPGLYEAIFPQTVSQVHLLEVISWLGVIMLLILTCFETDIQLIARKGKGAAAISAGRIAVPFFAALGLGFVLPADFIAKPDQRLVFALFIGTAMSISAIPVIAKVLMELKIIRRDIGQVTLATGMIDDTVGWILLSVVAGMASRSGATITTAGKSLIAVLAVTLFSFTIGRRAMPALVRFERWFGEITNRMLRHSAHRSVKERPPTSPLGRQLERQPAALRVAQERRRDPRHAHGYLQANLRQDTSALGKPSGSSLPNLEGLVLAPPVGVVRARGLDFRRAQAEGRHAMGAPSALRRCRLGSRGSSTGGEAPGCASASGPRGRIAL